MRTKTIAFFFPYHEVSGVPVLFSNIAEHLSNNPKYKIVIVDYSDGYMATILKYNKKIKQLPFSNGKQFIIDTDILIIQSILPFQMRAELKISETTKLFFWNLYPKNLIPRVYSLNILFKKNDSLYKYMVSHLWKKKYNLIKDFILKANRLGGLSFMDSSNFMTTKDFYNINLKEKSFLPIACSDGRLRKNDAEDKLREINVSWIGRLCDFKIHILNYFIQELSKTAVELSQYISLHIIGDGPEKGNLRSKEHINNHFNINIIGRLSKIEMDNFLFSTIDLNGSMGTSVLESAKYGIPSIVLDISMIPINQHYKFRWLHDTKDFDVGHFINNSDYAKHNNMTEMITEFIENREDLSKKTYEYYLNNHSLEAVSNNFIAKISKSKLTVADINPSLIKKDILRRLYERKKYGKIT